MLVLLNSCYLTASFVSFMSRILTLLFHLLLASNVVDRVAKYPYFTMHLDLSVYLMPFIEKLVPDFNHFVILIRNISCVSVDCVVVFHIGLKLSCAFTFKF